MQLLVSAALLAVAVADNAPAYAPAPAYHAAPAYKEEKLPPQPFAYEYGVADDYGKETAKLGSFGIARPDGRVTYED